MRIEAVRGDITHEDVDAIVNAANSSLLGGGGVDGAIHRAAGPELLAECMELRRTELPDGLPVGGAVPTAGYRLRARWVIHTVGPNARRGQTDPDLLASCFTSCLVVATEVGAPHRRLPGRERRAYGWDVDEVARIAVGAVGAFGSRQENRDGVEVCGTDVREVGTTAVELVRFVLHDDRALEAFSRELG
ncbi:macro domain-containing protein [Georgenia sp. SUBG003]|uniref:macro domain-containing protein n=1 Tax=Georgenia sp. SUBG003 TaxID=1497974 RepID=UPI0005B85AAD